jgi:hypothetical protein
MAPNSWLRLSLLLPLMFLVQQSAANAAPSLADAIKEVDAKYLEAPDVEGEDNAPKIEAGGGEEDTTPKPQEISQGAVRAALNHIENKSEDGEISYAPVVTIFADGKEVAKIEGESTGFGEPPVSVQIAEIDPGNQYPEVVVSSLAGYVGEKILLGEGKQAWDLMLGYYDKASDWGLEVCGQPLDEDGECPVQQVKLTFPDALERMLNENGYKVGE